MPTFSRPASISNLGKFLGTRAREGTLQSIKFKEESVLFFDSFPLFDNPFRTVLGFKRSELRTAGENVDVDYERIEAGDIRRQILNLLPEPEEWRNRTRFEYVP